MRPSPFEDGITPLDADNLNERTVYAIGDLDALLTQNKTNLVAAINENKNSIDALPNKWNAAFYLDPISGSDDNPGTENAPFLTIEKAIESIPPGGIGTIYLKAATTFLINKNIALRGRRVKLTKWGTGDNPIITTVVSEGTDTVVLNYIGVDGGHINFDKVDLLLPEYNGDKPAHSTYNSLLIPRYNSYGAVGISFHYNKIILNRDFKLINGFNYGGGYDFLVSQFWGTEIVVNSANARLLQAYYSPTALQFGVVTITDNTDSNISLPDLIDGISRNPDGTPRNVLSNVSL